MLAFVLVVQTASKLYELTFQNIFSASYFIDISTAIASTMLMYIIFAPIGTEKEIERNDGYHSNVARWSELSAKIRSKGSVPEKRQITKLPSAKYTLHPSS